MLGRKDKPEEQRSIMSKPERETGDGAISLIAPGMSIVGDCETDGTVRIEGKVEGSIKAGKSVVVGRSGEVVGDIFTQDAIVSGRISGNITAESRLELQATCDIQGEIRSRRVQLDEGARFNGQIFMEEGPSRTVKGPDRPTVVDAGAKKQEKPEGAPHISGG